jgi:hypothetical protein
VLCVFECTCNFFRHSFVFDITKVRLSCLLDDNARLNKINKQGERRVKMTVNDIIDSKLVFVNHVSLHFKDPIKKNNSWLFRKLPFYPIRECFSIVFRRGHLLKV